MSGINTGDENKEITATYPDACKIHKRKPPIDILINVVPKLVEFLRRAEVSQQMFIGTKGTGETINFYIFLALIYYFNLQGHSPTSNQAHLTR